MTDALAPCPKTTEGLATLHIEHVEVGRLTLCGSTKFRDEYELWNKRLTLAGFLVYSVSGFGHSGDTFTDEEKVRLDQIHFAKIDASHAIVVINPGGYIGDSTRREIAHAERSGKLVYYTHEGRTVYQLRTGPGGCESMRYRAFAWNRRAPNNPETPGGGQEPVSSLTVVIDWYQRLPKRAREGLSLQNLHELSKALPAPPVGGVSPITTKDPE